MKQLFLILTVTLSVSTSSLGQQDWVWQNPKPQGNILNDVQFGSNTTIIAVGDGGTVLRSTDAGSVWDTSFCVGGRCADLNAVDLPIVVGDDGVILKTTNAGVSWISKTSGTGSSLNDVDVGSASVVIAVGAGGTVLRSTNTGESWSTISTSSSYTLNAVSYAGGTTWLSAGQAGGLSSYGIILRSTDNGLSWNPVAVSAPPVLDIQMVTSLVGRALSFHRVLSIPPRPDTLKIFATTDGGSSWVTDTSVIASFPTVPSLHALCSYFTGGGTPVYRFYVCGSSGSIWRSSSPTGSPGDWWVQSSGVIELLNGINYSPGSPGGAQDTIVSVGTGGMIVRSRNGGSTWQQMSSAVTRSRLFAVDFIDSKFGFAVGSLGTIVRTTNGGVPWTLESTPDSANLYAVEMLTQSIAVAVGQGGRIMKRTAGGIWNVKSSGTTNDLRSVSFVDSDTGWAVGVSGKVIKTESGGESWHLLPPPTTATLNGVKFVNAVDGWACGSDGVILYTADGGNTWSPQYDDPQALNGIDFVDLDHGFAVGNGGRIVRTINGENWTVSTSGTSQQLTAVSMMSSKLALVTSITGLVLSTTSGGSSWDTQWRIDSCVTKNFLNGVSYRGAGTAVGDRGTIVRTDSSFLTFVPPPPPGGHYFGVIPLGGGLSDTIVVVNTGLRDLDISSIASDQAEFGVSEAGMMPAIAGPDTGDWVIPPDSSLRLRIDFTPITAGFKTGHIIFTHGGVGSPETLTVSGSATDTTFLESFEFGYPPTKYQSSLCFPAHHKDVVAMVFVVPADGTLDTLHFKMCEVGALDDIVQIRIFRSTTGPHSGPGHGGYPDCTPWGYFPNTFDADNGIAAFTDDATGPWNSTTGGPASFPLQGTELWGLGGFPVIATANAVNSVAMIDLGSPLPVQKGDSILVTIRVNGPAGHTDDGPTEFASYVYPGTICSDSATPAWKFYEHAEKTSFCPDVPDSIGWRTVCDGDRLGGVVFNWWFTMTPAGATPPEISGVTEVNSTLSTDPQTVTATVSGFADVTSVFLGPCCDSTGGDFTYVPMVNSGGNQWTGEIPGQPVGTDLCYQIVATDVTGATTVSASYQYSVTGLKTRFYNIDTSVATSAYPPDSAWVTISPSSFFLPPGNFDGGGTAQDNGTAGPVDLGGPFVFFGDAGYQYAWIGIDGAIGLSKIENDTQYIDAGGIYSVSGKSIVADTSGNHLIMPLYADFETGPGTSIRYTKTPDRFIIEWDSLGVKSPPVGMERSANSRTSLSAVSFSLTMYRKSRPDTLAATAVRIGGYPIGGGKVEFRYDNVGSLPNDNLVSMRSRPDTLRSVLLNVDNYPAETAPPGPGIFGLCPVVLDSVCGFWNLLSLPVIPCDTPAFKSAVYPSSTSNASGWCGTSYCVLDPIEIGRGFWMKFSDNEILQIEGQSFDEVDIPLVHRWNIVGGTSYPVPISSVTTTPPGVVVPGTWWGYGACGSPLGYYPATTIEPGLGYWVKVNSPGGGTMHLSASPGIEPRTAGTPAGEPLTTLNQVTFRDATGGGQTLYLGRGREIGKNLADYDMPQSPPEGIFSASFDGGRLVEDFSATADQEIRSHVVNLRGGTLPITVEWSPGPDADGDALSISVSDGAGGKYFPETIVDVNHPLKITTAAVKRVVIKAGKISDLVPRGYSLDQCYPNPFNPLTTINYALPAESHVVLRVYDMLGRVVGTLVDGIQNAGYKSIHWDGGRFASGVYYYSIEATNLADPADGFRQVKKMALVK